MSSIFLRRFANARSLVRLVPCRTENVHTLASTPLSDAYKNRCVLVRKQSHIKPCFNLFHNTAHLNAEDIDTREDYCISLQALKDAVANDKVYLIDVRSQEEVDAGRIPAKRFLHVPVQEISDALNKLSDEEFEEKYGAPRPDKTGPNQPDIVLYCLAGVRSSVALKIAREAGYTNSRHFPDGWSGWTEGNR